MSVYEKLDALNITLPELTPPVAAFVPFLRSGNLLFSSGHIAKISGKPWVGQLGANLTTAQGKEAARAVAIDLMGTLHAAVGDLNQTSPPAGSIANFPFGMTGLAVAWRLGSGTSGN